MTLREIIKGKGYEVIAVDGSLTVAEAVRKMVDRNIGSLLVMTEGGTSGMFTERDVLKCWAAGKLGEFPISDVMTKDLIVVQASDSLEDAMTVMIQRGIRHLPVMDAGKIVSVLSMRDVVKAQVGQLQAEVHYLKEFLTAGG